MDTSETQASYRVMKTHDFNDCLFYRIACDCTDTNHDVEVEVEFDKNGILWVFLTGQLTVADWWNHYGFFGTIWKRITLVLKLLFTGWFEMNGEFLLLDEKHIDSIINFLHEIKDRNAKRKNK